MTIEKSLPNMVMVCVDGVENGDIYGRYFHRYKKEETFFPDSATLVIEMELAQSHQRKQKTVENMAGMCYTA